MSDAPCSGSADDGGARCKFIMGAGVGGLPASTMPEAAEGGFSSGRGPSCVAARDEAVGGGGGK